MTQSIALHAAALALSTFVTLGTFAAADSMATHQYAAADAVAVAQMPKLALQTVVVVGHRRASA